MNTLPTCPREDCTFTGPHHDHRKMTGEPRDRHGALDCAHVETASYTPCYAPRTPKPQPPAVVLPTVDEVEKVWRAAIARGERIRDASQAVLDLIAARVPVWVPVAPSDIRPGMRVRYVAAGGIEGIFTVESVEDGRFYFKTGYAWAEMSDDAWFIDPRTVPAEPEDPRVAVVREWLSVVPLDSDAGDEGLARDLLARLDAVRADA